MELIKPARNARILAWWLRGIMIVTVGILFLPWQQNIRATGSVTALKPEDRPQTVNTTIGGRIEKWFVQEGQFVKKGDTIIQISEIKDKYFDPSLLNRMDKQVEAKSEVIQAMKQKIAALDQQLAALREGMEYSIQKAKNKVEQNLFKVASDSVAYIAAKTELQIAQNQFERMDTLFRKGLRSLTDYEARKLKYQDASAKLVAAENKLNASRAEYFNSIIELNSIRAEYLDKLSKAESDRNSAIAYVFDSEGSLAKLESEYSSLSVRSSFYVIKAPQDGYVVKALKAGVGEIVKEAEPVVTIMPVAPELAVELYVTGNDVPLLSPGRKVRLQFDGWPAIQFSGWPSVAVGTFGGEIRVIDYVNSDNGKYRVLVTQEKNDPWPKQLRVGSGVYGWAMLDEVPVWFEIWRQLNGFPPTIDPEKSEKKKAKKGSKEDEE
ncbi:MAG: HlyD family secretion protein [Bacteroidia bacterium]|nr:HlyD family secretion protein [Bacteroidia bacterium]